MSTHIRVLVVDDSEDDALLLNDELESNGFDVTYEVVDTPGAMAAALSDASWDVVIADYTMPSFSGPDALKILQATGLDIPFILVSGTTPEDVAVQVLRAGAQDFILKHSLSRLAPAVKREMAEAEGRRMRVIAEQAVRVSERNFRAIFEHSPVAILTCDQNAAVLQANPAFERLFGIRSEEAFGRSVPELLNPAAGVDAARRAFAGEGVENVELEVTCADGRELCVLVSATPVSGDQEEAAMTLLMFTDITERKAAEQLEREVEAHKREFYRRTILAFTGGKLVIAEREEIVRLAGQEIAAWQLADVQDLGTMRDAVKRRLLGVGVDEQRVFDFVGSVVEAATNALKHASGGRATLHLNHESVLLVVSDGGAGIEALALPDVALTRGYSTTATLGMGYKVMLAFSDRVYLATGPDGTAVAIEMKLQPAPNADSAQLQKLSGW